MEIGACAETEVYRRLGRDGGGARFGGAAHTDGGPCGPSFALFDRIFNIIITENYICISDLFCFPLQFYYFFEETK